MKKIVFSFLGVFILVTLFGTQMYVVGEVFTEQW